MKKIFAFFVVLTTFSCLFANNNNSDKEINSYTDFYTTFGFFSDKFQDYVPSVSLGKKIISTNGNGIDFGGTIGFLERKGEEDDYVVMFPRVEYIHYGSKDFKHVNGYLGLGACTAAYRLQQGHYEGIVGSATVGFDFYREKNMNGFIQAKSYYPILSFNASNQKGFPLLLVDIGLGF